MIHKILITAAVLQFAFIFLCDEAACDTLVLRNGSVISGKVEDPSVDPIYLRIPSGRISFTHDEIAEIRIDGAVFKPRRLIPSAASGADEDETDTPPISEEERRHFLRLIQSLGDANDEDEDFGLTEKRESIVGALARMGRVVAPLLEEEFLSGSPDNAPYIMMALAEVDQKRAGNVATDTVREHNSPVMRQYAAEILGDLDPKRHADALKAATRDPQGNVRVAALIALGQTKDPAYVQTLVRALDDNVKIVRQAAARALSSCVTDVPHTNVQEWRDWASQQKAGPAQPPQ